MQETPIGLIPKAGSLNTNGLTSNLDYEQLFSIPKDFWLKECNEIRKYFIEQVGTDLPSKIDDELNSLERRLKTSP